MLHHSFRNIVFFSCFAGENSFRWFGSASSGLGRLVNAANRLGPERGPFRITGHEKEINDIAKTAESWQPSASAGAGS